MACGTISTRLTIYQLILAALTLPLHCFADDNNQLTNFFTELNTIQQTGHRALNSVYKNSSLELSYTYPNNIITVGIKYHPAQIGAGISYNHNQKNYFFRSESSPATNPYIVLGTDLLLEQLNIIAEQHQKNSKIQAYIQELHQGTSIKQKEERNHLNKVEDIIKNKL